jgi:protein arginine N-methyltransferase 2
LITDLYDFFEHVGDLLSGQNARFSFFNGLGATSEFKPIFEYRYQPYRKFPDATFYDVYTKLSALHLEDMALITTWEDVEVHAAAEGEGAWGETRKYFSLPVYRMPICVPMQ